MTTLASSSNNNNTHLHLHTPPPDSKTSIKMPVLHSTPPPNSFAASSPPPSSTTATASSSPPTSLANLPPPPPPPLEQLRLQQLQLYTLALADRMRSLHAPMYPPPPPPPPQANIPHPPRHFPSDLPPPHPLYPYGKFDPRLFRLPDEPKPQHSYIGLIAMAILSSSDQKLVLADIYQYILDNFPYFRHRGPGWRNSIRHNLSLNDCFIKAGRAANGKGHYWAIHPACIEDFKKGDYRRRKAQRKVRKHMGLAVDEEDSPSPPPAPNGGLPPGWPPFLMAHPHPHGPPLLHHPQPHRPHPHLLFPHRHHPQPPQHPPQTETVRKRQFDVASLLGQAFSNSEEKKAKKDEDEDEDEANKMSPFRTIKSLFSPPNKEIPGKVDVVSVGEEEDDMEDDEETKKNNETESEGEEGTSRRREEDSTPSSSHAVPVSLPAPPFPWPLPLTAPHLPGLFPPLPPPPPQLNGHPATTAASASSDTSPPPLFPHEYLARYYQLMQHAAAAHQQQLMQREQQQSEDEN